MHLNVEPFDWNTEVLRTYADHNDTTVVRTYPYIAEQDTKGGYPPYKPLGVILTVWSI